MEVLYTKLQLVSVMVIGDILIILEDYASSSYPLTITISNVTYKQNIATNKGGGLYLDYEGIQMTNSTFLKNKAMYGAGLYFIRPSILVLF